MNDRLLKKLILQEIKNVLNEYKYGPEDLTDEEQDNQLLIDSVVGWVKDLKPVSYRQLLTDIQDANPRLYGTFLSAIQNAMSKKGYVSLDQANFFAEMDEGKYGLPIAKALKRSGYINLVLQGDRNY